VVELVLGWDGISPEKPGVAEYKLVCICPELEGPGCGCRNLEGPGMAKRLLPEIVLNLKDLVRLDRWILISAF
jgi:hypothetical protein